MHEPVGEETAAETPVGEETAAETMLSVATSVVLPPA
jgi:hypothetical protein